MLPVKVAVSFGLGLSTMLFAQAEQAIASDATISAIGNLGLAIVISAGSFSLLAWWFKKNVQDQRADYNRQADRITHLEDKLFEATERQATAAVQMVDAIKENTKTLAAMADAITELNNRIVGRTCFAVDAMKSEDRAKVLDLIRRGSTHGEGKA